MYLLIFSRYYFYMSSGAYAFAYHALCARVLLKRLISKIV